MYYSSINIVECNFFNSNWLRTDAYIPTTWFETNRQAEVRDIFQQNFLMFKKKIYRIADVT